MLKYSGSYQFVFVLGVLIIFLSVFIYDHRNKFNASNDDAEHTNIITESSSAIINQKKIAELNRVSALILKESSDSYIRKNGMVEGEKNKTTSESQSYGLLLAVHWDNRVMFDTVWEWTKNHLQIRSEDKLFSWLWQNGKVSDINPATDADQDIAYALYLAYKQWGDDAYLRSSLEIVRDIWKVETEQIQDARYVGAGNWAVNDSDGVIINPSYLAPYQYRVFAEIDPEHDWMGLVDSSYKTLNLCTGGVGLAQDWCKIDNQGNVVKNFRLSKNDSSVYSYDALRVPYRVSMDYALNNDPRAIEYLRRNKVFIESWKKNGKIFSVYNQQGRYVGKGESLASYGAQLASMSLIDKDVAQDIFEKKIAKIESFKDIGFYDLSWLWFGSHFYLGVLNKEAGT